jgi:hypothetical protein
MASTAPPAAASEHTDPAPFAPILEEDGTIDLLQVGRINNLILRRLCVTKAQQVAWDALLNDPLAGQVIRAGAAKYEQHLQRMTPERGGTVERVHMRSEDITRWRVERERRGQPTEWNISSATLSTGG